MILLSPLFLWGLLMLVPLAGVYLLKVRPRRHPVTAIFLWDKIFTQRKANALLQRLRDLLSLLLLALAAIALVLASSRPRFDGGDHRDVLVMIDRSVSMSADADPRRPGYSRFDAAVDRAESLLRALGGQRRAAIATVDDQLDFVVLMTDEPRRLREALREVRPGQIRSDDQALRSIEQLAGLSEDLRVVILTDGVGIDLAPAEDSNPFEQREDEEQAQEPVLPGGIEFVLVGSRPGQPAPRNVGLTAADLVATGDGDNAALLFSLASSFTETVSGELVLTSVGPNDAMDVSDLAGPALKVIPLDIVPGENPPQVFRLAVKPGRYVLQLSIRDGAGEVVPDSLALDDTAYLSVAAPKPLRIAVDAADRYFFETAVQAFARRGDLMQLVPDDGPAELSIFRGSVPSESNAANSPSLRVVFAPNQVGPGVASAGELLEAALPRVLLPDHPVLRFIPAESITFDGARQVEPAPGSAVLVADVTGVPLIWQTRDPDKDTTTMVVNLDPAAADFVLSPYFPVLVYATATHLGGRTADARSTFSTGTRVDVPGLRPGATANVRFADGTNMTTDGTRPVRLTHAGFHQSETLDAAYDLPASVLHPVESLLALDLEAAPRETDLPSGYPPWAWLTLIALLIVAAEEVLYHRRKVG